MKKKLKIVLLTVAGLVILYHLMFVEIRLYDSKFNHLGAPDKMSSWIWRLFSIQGFKGRLEELSFYSIYKNTNRFVFQ